MELSELGLPSHHQHYRTGGAGEDGAELLQTSDITVSFTRDAVLPDKIYTAVDAFCGLECGRGRCVVAAGEKLCACELGWAGLRCEEQFWPELHSAPALSGQGFLALPTLQNAYSDLHLALEFMPKQKTGLLLLTGQTEDMTGDYLALLLTEGYLELRLDCGTGPGLVRSFAPVNIGQWNTLIVFRHDWGVWMQLNGGPKQEGRSQVRVELEPFRLPVNQATNNFAVLGDAMSAEGKRAVCKYYNSFNAVSAYPMQCKMKQFPRKIITLEIDNIETRLGSAWPSSSQFAV